MLDFFYSGGWPFYFLELFYIYTFDLLQRQRTKFVAGRPEKNWENPNIYGINRREAHVPLRAFPSRAAAQDYWARGGGLAGSDLLSNIFLLTGPAGTPDQSHPWRFSLFGSPESVPDLWNQVRYNSMLFASSL